MELPARKHEEGTGLRGLRLARRMTLQGVEELSADIARKRGNPLYRITAGRLSQIENNRSVPGLFKLISLSEIYKVPFNQLLEFYGVVTDTWRS